MDGYSTSEELLKQYNHIQYLSKKQMNINNELDKIVGEMQDMPEIPHNIDNWIDSISKTGQDFKLSDFRKLFEINKRYNKLVEERETNTRTIKIMAIDNLIGKIEELLK